MMENFVQNALTYGPAILMAITIHEFFHAWTAMRFGDDTAARMGRLTLNPLAHLDLFGTFAMIITGFRFGWAKPVPVNPANLRNYRVADIWISLAGPLSNLGLAIIAGIVYRLGGDMTPDPFPTIITAVVHVNIILFLFNLLPLFPLDGSHVVRHFVPMNLREAYAKFERVSPIVLLVLVFTGAFFIVLSPLIRFLVGIILG